MKSLSSYLEFVLTLVPRGQEQHHSSERMRRSTRSGEERALVGSIEGGRRKAGSSVQQWEKVQWEK